MTEEELGWEIQRPFWAVGFIVLLFVGAALFGKLGGRNPGDPPPMRPQPEAGQLIAIRYDNWYAYYDEEFQKPSEQNPNGFGVTLSWTAPDENVSEITEAMTFVTDQGEPRIVSRGRKLPRQNVIPLGIPWRQTFDLAGARLNADEFLYAPPAAAGDREKYLAKEQIH